MLETYYQIETFIPEENAIGKESFWTILNDAVKIIDKEYALKTFTIAEQMHGVGNVRLVKFTRCVILE